MQIDLMCRAFASGGGGPLYCLAAGYLQNGLDNYGSGLKAIEIVACFRGGQIGHPSLKSMYDKYHSTFLPSLPFLKFARKQRRFFLTYETEVADATLLERKAPLSAELFRHVVEEMARMLHLLDTRIKSADGFDLRAFHAAVARQVATTPRTDKELQLLKTTLDHEDEARRAGLSEWDRLAVEWDDFHPCARQILNDPFFWDVLEEYSPHGNDTGADALSHFVDWNRRHAKADAYELAPILLQRWGVPKISYEITEAAVIHGLLDTSPSSVVDTDDAIIGIAFAAIKVRGCCDRKTRELGLAAIQREQMRSVMAYRGWTEPAERLRTLRFVRDTLAGAPETTPSARSARSKGDRH